MQKKFLIVIVGPTAIGKTSMAIQVAKHFRTEIISSDSRQFYKEMNIGTAVPNSDELNEVQHHFIQNKSIDENYSVGDFEREAIDFIENYFTENRVLVMVGGSGLYEKAVTEGLDDFPEIPPKIRENLKKELNDFGFEKLQSELKKTDIEYYETVDIQNPQRVLRALEIIRGTGKQFSSFRKKNAGKRNFEVIKIGLELPREEIYNRINSRVNAMMQNGLLQEAENLFPKRNLNALQTVGYRELFDYFDGKISLEFSISEIKKNTRRFAKRQLTWYRKDDAIHWFSPTDFDKVIDLISAKINPQ